MIITAGKYKGRKIIAPNEKITRPTLSKVRMGVFNTLYSIIGDFTDKNLLDVFGGSGIISLEALSRGFNSATIIEHNKFASKIIQQNFKLLNIEPNLIVGDSLKILQKLENIYDVAYIDPPYLKDIYYQTIELVNAKLIILEHSENLSLDKYNIIKTKNYGGKKLTFITK